MVFVHGHSCSIARHGVYLEVIYDVVFALSKYGFDPYFCELIFNKNYRSRFNLSGNGAKGCYVKFPLE